MQSFLITTNDEAFRQGVALSVPISIQIGNIASGTHDSIKDESSGANFNFDFNLRLTDKDLQADSTGDITIPLITPALDDDNERKLGLATGWKLLISYFYQKHGQIPIPKS